MRHISLSVAFVAAIALAGLTPAKAELNGPVQMQGQCKQRVSNNHNGIFFYWAACPKPASTTITVHRSHHRG